MARSILLAIAFFLSGAAALAFESLWWQQAGLAFGNSVWASSAVLSAFMLGLALGGRFVQKRGDRIRDPLRTFAWLELGVAGSGVALVFLLPALGGLLAPLTRALLGAPGELAALRFAIAFTLLLVPALAMGTSLPLLVRAFAGRHGFGRALSLLYGVNTLGAVCGALVTETQWLAAFGVYGSAICAGALDVGAAALALWAARGSRGEASAEPLRMSETSVTPDPARRVARLRYAFATALAGAAMLALEVVWLRASLLFLNDTPLAFAAVLATVLSGIALGSFGAGLGLGRAPRAAARAPLVAYAAGALGVLAYRAYPWFLQRGFSADQHAGTVVALTAPLMLPTALASGALFATTGAALRAASASDSAGAGELAFANTLGAAAGPLLAAFVLLPRIGMEWALFVLFALYGVIGLLLTSAGSVRAGHARYAAPALFALALCAFPFGTMRSLYLRSSASRWMRPGDQLVQVREGTSATYVHIAHRLNGQLLFEQIATNAYSMSVDDYQARRYMKLFALLPMALHPKLERALCIGYGVGNTAEMLTTHRDLRRLDVVDTAPEMLALARTLASNHGRVPLDYGRVHVRIEDGRQVLAAGGEGYDLITGEPPPPIIAGVNALYSAEYFELMRARLRAGGIATYWLPLMNISAESAKALIAAFCSAFDDCSLWHGAARNLMLMGTRDARGPVSAEHFARSFAGEDLRGELAAIGFEHEAQLGPLFIGDAAYLNALTTDVEPLRDAWPKRLEEARDQAARDGRDALLWEFRDTRAARTRFLQSAFVARLWPEELKRASLRQFENQRLINDLMFPGPTKARQLGVLDQVLSATPLRFPVLLLLGSDSDAQRALARVPREQQERAEWLPHRLAELIAERDLVGAKGLLERHPEMRLALPGLREYVARAGER